MNKNINLIISFLFTFLLIVACVNEIPDYSKTAAPEVLLLTDTLSVDLNSSINPSIICVIHSEAGLKSVNEYILKTGNVEQPIGNQITTFFDVKSFSIMQTPSYTEDMTGFKVVAIDIAGRTIEKLYPFKITPLRNPPVVFYNDSILSLDYTEGSTMPHINISISSDEDLKYIVLSEIINHTENIIKISSADTLHLNAGTKTYKFDMTSDGYQFKSGITALKTMVAAGNSDKLKLKVATLTVNFIGKLPPAISFSDGSGVLNVNEFENFSISGSVSAESGLKSVQFFEQTPSGDIAIGTPVNFTTLPTNYPFTTSIVSIATKVTGFAVVATDALGKVTRTVKPITVKELAPAPTISINQDLAAFNGVDLNSSLTISGSISSLAGLTKVSTILIYRDGSESPTVESITNPNQFAISKTMNADNNLAGIRFEGTDVNNKLTVTKVDIHVGYYYYETIMSLEGSEDKATTLTGPTPGCFFSAKTGRAYMYCDAKSNWQDIDIAFLSFSTNTAIRVVNLPNVSAKMNNLPLCGCGKETWPGVTSCPLGLVTTITRNTFDAATINDIAALKVPAFNATQIVDITTGGFSSPNTNVLIYSTTINGQIKKVILTYKEFVLQTPLLSHCQFKIKVKVQK